MNEKGRLEGSSDISSLAAERKLLWDTYKEYIKSSLGVKFQCHRLVHPNNKEYEC